MKILEQIQRKIIVYQNHRACRTLAKNMLKWDKMCGGKHQNYTRYAYLFNQRKKTYQFECDLTELIAEYHPAGNPDDACDVPKSKGQNRGSGYYIVPQTRLHPNRVPRSKRPAR
ncbi:MAG: hypothetical protein IJU89_00640 [Alphaproteobacteria bacterium]|nr:hypothetical protein [Alphaproteobacteria bacterium]